jgi:predicted Abi (CAAX) family protease
MPSIGQTWVLASIGVVVEMGVLSTLKRLLMESFNLFPAKARFLYSGCTCAISAGILCGIGYYNKVLDEAFAKL